MEIRNQKDFGAGLMYMTIGLFFALMATHYPMGTTAKMGPGYFPFWLGLLLSALGLVILTRSLNTKAAIEKLPRFHWKIVGLISGSVILFGVALPILGFAIAIVVLVLLSASASHEFKWKGSLVNAILLAAATYLVFVVGLKLPFPLLPFFLQ